jgi:hypothetical protein
MRNQTWIVTIDTAPASLSLLHMTNVYFSLYVEAVAMSRGSGCSLVAETNQDHSIHTPHKHKHSAIWDKHCFISTQRLYDTIMG